MDRAAGLGDGGALRSALVALGRWAVATAMVGAVWVAVTLVQGGRLHLTYTPCGGDPDADLKMIAAMSAVLGAPVAAAWSAARVPAARRPAARGITAAALVFALLVALAVLLVYPVGCNGHP